MLQIVPARPRPRLSLLTGVFVVLLMSVSPVCPSDAQYEVADLADLSIEELLNAEVVTAGKRAERMSESPAAVFVITSEDIERYGYQSLSQALRRISGFYADTDRNYDYLGVRAFLPNSDYNRRVLLLINGHRVNDCMYQQAPLGQDLPLDMRDIERIEVVKGPGSALWGTDAMLCVINCITKTPEQMEGFQVRQDTGWWFGNRISYGGGSADGLRISGSFSRVRSDGEGAVYFPDYDTPDDNNGVAVGLDGERVRRSFLDMSYKGFRLFLNNGTRTKDIPTASNCADFNTPGTDATDERTSWELSYESDKPLPGNGKFFGRVYHDTMEYVGHFPGTYIVDETPMLIKYTNHGFAKSHGAELRYLADILPRLSGIAGVEYLRVSDAGKHTWDEDPYYVYTSYRSTSTIVSCYAESDWSVNDRLRAIAGFRLDHDSWFGSHSVPRLALIYRQSPDSVVKLLYGKAFRAASQSERRTPEDCPGLRPESIKTAELVWEKQIGHNSRLVTSLFDFSMYDLIIRDDGVTFNYGGVDSRGVDVQLDYRFKNGASAYLGLSLAQAQSHYPEDDPLLDSAEQVASAGFCTPILAGKAFLATELQYMGPRATYYANEVGASAIANLSLTSTSLIKNGRVSLGIVNLLNTPTMAPGRYEHVQDVLPQYGRQVHFQVSYGM